MGQADGWLQACEAFWRNRQSQSDKAHAAEAKVLRERIAALEAGSKGTAPEGAGTGSDTSGMDEVVKRLQVELENEKRLRITETRTAKYPNATKAIGDERVISQIDEARLASLEETLRPPTGSGIDRNNPARRVTGEKPISEMTTEELKAHFRTIPVPGVQPS